MFWYTLLHGQAIPYLFTHNYILRRPTGHLYSHKACPLLGPWLGNQRPQLTLILTQISWPTCAPTKLLQHTSFFDQISSTDIHLRSILSSHHHSCHYSAMVGLNQSKPWPNIFNRRRVYQDLYQVTRTLLVRLRGYSWISPKDVAVPHIFSNRRHNSMNYCQTTTRLSNLEPWPPPEAFWNIESRWSSGTFVVGFLHLYYQ